EHGPADVADLERAGGRERGAESRLRRGNGELRHAVLRAFVDEAENLLQVLAVGRDRLFVRLLGARVALPKRGALLDGGVDLAKEEAVDAGNHLGGEVALLVQRGGAREGVGRLPRDLRSLAGGRSSAERPVAHYVGEEVQEFGVAQRIEKLLRHE